MIGNPAQPFSRRLRRPMNQRTRGVGAPAHLPPDRHGR